MDALTSSSISRVVGDDDLASVLGDYPPVLATSRMIAWMEIAAAQCIAPLLEDGELSVGVIVDVRHTAATPKDALVWVHARYLGIEGRLHMFEVWGEDPGGEFGRGRHGRAIITLERLMAGAARRGGT